MRNFTETDIKEMVRDLYRHYAEDNGCMTYITEAIAEWAEEHDLINDIPVEGEFCVKSEIERGYWVWEGYDCVSYDDYDKKYYIIDIAYEDNMILVYVTRAQEEPF